MDNFDLKKYLTEGRIYEEEYPDLIQFLTTNVEKVKQHMRDALFISNFDDEMNAEENEKMNKIIDTVKSFEDVSKETDGEVVGAMPEGDMGASTYQIVYMFKDDYDNLEDKSKFQNYTLYGPDDRPPKDVKIAGKDLKFFIYTM